MEEQSKDAAAAAAANSGVESGSGRGSGSGSGVGSGIPNRRTAAIDVLTRALKSTTVNVNVNVNANFDTAADGGATAGPAARSFLEQTCSVYVLDAAADNLPTNNSSSSASTRRRSSSSTHNIIANNNNNNMPKIFGCWNFLHQAMNEIERFEEEEQLLLLRQRQHQQQQQQQQQQQHQSPLPPPPAKREKRVPLKLLSETRLLAEFAVKVARRSDDLDRQKVATCVENFCSGSSGSSGTSNADSTGAASNVIKNDDNDNDNGDAVNNRQRQQQQWLSNNNYKNNNNNDNNNISVLLPQLIRANAEIREIVTGRIAAFSFNNSTTSATSLSLSSSSPPSSVATTPPPPSTSTSALEDPVVVETFCKFLAANAVSNGPERLRRFLNDWIIPGAADDDDNNNNNNNASTATTTITTATAIADNNNNTNTNDANNHDIRRGSSSDYNNNNNSNNNNYHNNNTTNTTSSGGGGGQGNGDNNSNNSKRQRLSPSSNKSKRLHHRLPPYSLACVLFHVAAESTITTTSSPSKSENVNANSNVNANTISPYGTIDVLQRLSLPVMANVLLGPVLHDGLKRQQSKRQLKQQQIQDEGDNQDDDNDDDDDDDADDMIVAMGLRAISTWCATTDLSLAQIKHIGSKVRINLSNLLGEALHTDSPKVMNALADLIEDVVERHVVPQQQQQSQSQSQQQLISEARMTQTRYLMQVPDEKSFRANVSQEQLHVIETKELSDILRELSEDVERQRFRFPSFGGGGSSGGGNNKTDGVTGKNATMAKKPQGEVRFDERAHALGHSLARIAAAVCLGYAKVTQAYTTTGATDTTDRYYRIPGTGLLELLSKCASHPSVAICGIVLPVVTPVLKTEVGLATQWLPTLQRRAIIPHHPNNAIILSSSSNNSRGNDAALSDITSHRYIPLLAASDICFVEFEEFVYQFRETVLADALNACYGIHSEYYLASCTAAIEEFCVGDVGTEQTSFHLEAALFCLAVVSERVLPSVLGTLTTTATPGNIINANASSYLLRCTAALAKKPKSLSNPLTMAQACRFVRKYAKWFGSNQHPGILDIAADLTLFILSQCATTFSDSALSSTIYRESGVTPYSEAAKTLRCLLSNNANHFLSNKAIAALGAGWEATFVACNRSGKLLTLEDRKDTCIGICHVLAALTKDQQQTSLMALAIASIACLEAMVKRADSITSTKEKVTLSPILDRAADEIIILATIARAFTDAMATAATGVGNGRASFVEPSMAVLRRAWPTISIVASKYSFHDSILDSLNLLFVECIPTKSSSDVSTTFLQELCALAKKVIENENARQNNQFFVPVLNLINLFIQVNGNTFEKIALSRQGGDNLNNISSYSEKDREMYKCLDSLTRETITAMTCQHLLGSTWTSVQKQGNGESAFETKPKLEYSNADFCNAGLAPMFSLLHTCAKRCPMFLLHILAEPDGDEADYSNDSSSDLPMLRKAMDSAVSSIIHSEAEISIQAIAFLESVVSLATQTVNNTNNNNTINIALRKLAEEYNFRFKTSMLCTLLRGTCGMYQPVVVPDACRLFLHALSTSVLSTDELEVLVLRGLSQEHFFLGDRAWRVIYNFCLQCLRTTNSKTPSLDEVENMMTGIWQLHRFENVDAIETSDIVHAFCIQYGQKKSI